MTINKQSKRGSGRTNRQPLGLVSANTPPKTLKLSNKATARQPLGYVSANTPPPKQNPSNSNIHLLPRDIFGRIKFNVVEIESEHVCATTAHDIAAAEKNTASTSIDDKNDNNQHLLSPSSNSSSSSSNNGSIAPNSTTTVLSMKDNAISETTFLPPKYFFNAAVDVKEKHGDDDDEPSIGSVSSTSTTSSQFSFRGMKRTVSVKTRKKFALVPKFLTSKSKSNKKAYREEIVPPEYIFQLPTKELLSKASSTLEYSFVPSKYNTVSTAVDAGQGQEHDKPSMSISHNGIKYTLSIKDLIDCYHNFLVEKQAVVRTEQRTSRTIYGKNMPRVLRLRLKRCALDNDVIRYKALKLCQRIILQRLKVHNEIRRKSIRSIRKKMNTTDPIRESSSLHVNQSVGYSIPQDIQRIMLQRKKIHNELRRTSIQSIRMMNNADLIPINLSTVHRSVDFTPGAYHRINSIALSVSAFFHWLILFLLQDFTVMLCLELAYILRLFAENAEKLATFLKSTKSTVQVVENGSGSPRAPPVQYIEPTRALLH